MSNENRVSAREYWLDRIDEVCDGERRRLLESDSKDLKDEALLGAAARSLGITRLLNRRKAAEKRAAEASAAASKVDDEIAKAIGVENRGWSFQHTLDSRIAQEKQKVRETVYRRSATGRKVLELDEKRKQLRDRVMSARRPKDYDGIEEEIGRIGE
jgi:hypothetical protein